MFSSEPLFLWALLPLLLAVWLFFPRRRRIRNLPKMVEKGYSSLSGHIGYIVSANNLGVDQHRFNLYELFLACPEPVVAVYPFGPKWLMEPLYCVKDPQLISIVHGSKAKRYGPLQSTAADIIGRSSLLSLEGDELRRHRKLMTSSILARRALVRFVEIMGEKAARFLSKLPQSSQENPLELDLLAGDMVGMLVVDSFSHFAFGIDTTPSNPTPTQVERRDRLLDSLQFTCNMFMERLSTAGPMRYVSYLNVLKNWNVRKNKAFIRKEYVLPAIRQRREDMKNGVGVPDDALTLMLESAERDDDDAFTEAEICDEGMLMIVAGYETTAMSVLWALYQLGSNPEQQELCYREVVDVMSKQAPGSLPSITDVDRMAYLQCAIQESMRLTPITPSHSRELAADLDLGAFTVPAGSTVLTYFQASALSDEVYDKADQFIPERWRNDPTGGAKKPGATSIPFGQGQYRCFGQPLAQQALRTLVALWVQRYRFEVISKDVKPVYRVGLVPSDLRVRMRPRQQN